MRHRVTALFVLFCCVVGLFVGWTPTSVVAKPCSGIVITNDTLGLIRDHSGGGNYTRPEYCYWIITSPSDQQNNQIALVFDYFSSVYTSNVIDYLNIKDGNSSSAPDLVWLSGELKNPPAVVSTGNALYLEWYVKYLSYYYAPSARGFEVQYSSSSCPEGCNWKDNQGYCFNGQCFCSGGWRGVACDIRFCDNNCGGSSIGTCQNNRCHCSAGFYGGDCLSPVCDPMTVLTDANMKNFSSSHPYFEGTNVAVHTSNCSWLIKPDGAVRIALQFSEFDLEEDNSFVDIYDGESINAPLARRFTGSSIPPKFTSTGGAVLIHYYAGTGVDHSGFTASYTASFPDGASVSPSPAASESAVVTPDPGRQSTTVTPRPSGKNSDDDSNSSHDAGGSHNALFMMIGILIGALVSLVTVAAYFKWKEHKQSSSRDGVKFHTFDDTEEQ